MAKIGYARVSTRGQNTDSQADELAAYGCGKIFTDKVTGKHAERPELDKALAYLREGDVLVITRLSRAMRSLKHLIHLAEELRARRRPGGPQAADRHDHADRPPGLPYPRRDRRVPARADRRGHPRGPRRRPGPRPLRRPPAQAERRQGRHHTPHVPGHRTGWQEAAHRRRDRPDRRHPPHHRLRLPQERGLTWPPTRRTRPGTPGRSSAACCSAGTSSSTRKPRKSSPPPSRPRSKPAPPPNRRADARIPPPPAASLCSDPAATGLIQGW